MNKFIPDLDKKYKLNKIEKRRLNSELKLLKLKLEFSIHIAKKEKLSFHNAVIKCVGVRELAEKKIKKEYKPIINYLKQIKLKEVNKARINKIALELLITSPLVKNIRKHKKETKCFRYEVYKNKSMMIHFKNAVVPKNPLKGKELENRKEELRKIAKELKKKHPDVKKLWGSSWIRNIKIYSDLLPKECKKNSKPEKKIKFYHGGYWGQFYKYNG
ncbi:MAG: hypothetical protein KKH88_02255, partial [Nanoarchaeota archaeon]|nr:hypothetical protein [Nanoarchaeota archaeon]